MAKARIEITGNSQSFEQAAKRVNADLRQMNSNAETTGRSVSEFGNKAKAAFAGIVSTAAVGAFVKQMATVRGQFQQYEIALSTMLQSEEKAATLMGELLELAAKTPFDLQGVVEGAKQLMAYGTSAEEMTETLTMLGDVAAGLSIPLGDLVYLYGTTMTQGRVFTMDMRQFMARGIPMAEELAKQFGVTKEAVSGLVTEGKVGADAITKAFQSMTSEGGKFENLMVRQSASITGQISNLQDSIQTMFNDLGKMNEGVIYDAISGAAYLVEHYKDIADILVPLIATFGAYKVALIAVAAAQRAVVSAKSISAFFSLAKSIHSAKDAMLLLNMSMNANTIGLVVAAIAALATTTTILIRRANEAEEAANRAKKAFKDETSELTTMIEVLNDSNMAYEDRKRALDKIRDMVPDYHASLTQEGQLINNNTAAIDRYLESLEKEILMKTLYDDLEKAIQKRENLKDGDFILSLIGVTGGKKAKQRIVDDAVAAVEDIKEKIKTASKGEDASILGPFLPEGFDKDLGRVVTAMDLIKDARRDVSDIAEELERIKASPELYGTTEKWAAAIKEAEKNLKDAQDTLDTLTGGLLGGPVGLIAKIEEVTSALNEKKKAATSISEIAAINDEIAALQQLKEGYEKVSAAMLEMSKTPIPSVTGGDVTGKVTTTKQQGVDIDALTKKYGKQKKEVQEIEQSFIRITDAVYRIISSGLELGEMFGLDPEILRALNDMVGSVLDIVDSMDAVTKATNSAAEAMGDVGTSMGQTGSAVLAVFGALISISSAIIKIDMAMQQANFDERVARINSELLRVKHLVDDIGSSMGEGWFVTDNFEKVKGLNAELTTLASHAAVAMKQWVNSFADFLASSDDWRKYVKTLLGDVTDLANQINSDALASALSGQMLGNIDALNDALKQMEELAQEGTDAEKAMAATAIELLEQAIGTYDELRSTISAMVGDISGTLYNTVTVEWKKIWQENKEAGVESFEGIAEAAKKNIAQIMENMVTQQIWASVMAPVFDSFGTDLTNAIAGGGDITSVFDDFFAGFDAQLKGYYDAIGKFYSGAEAKGWDFTEPKSDTSAETDTSAPEGSIKAMREELSKLQEQWNNLTAEEREGDLGKQLFGDIKDLEAKIEAAESLYDVMTDIEGSINDLNNKLSELNEQWNALSPEDREGAIGQGIKADIAFYENLLDEAQGVQQSELEKLKALIYSSAAKNSLYKKWIELYGDEIATQMMGEMLGDAQGYVDELRKGISDLSAKVKAGTATDEEITQLEAWEQQLQDIMNSGAVAAKQAASEAYQSWNDALNDALKDADTDYDKMGVLVGEYMSAWSNYASLDAGPMKDAAKEYLDYLAGLLEDQHTLIENNLRETYKTQEQANAETLKTFEDDLKYAREVLQDEDLAKEIERQRDEYLSELANVAIESSEEYQLIFGDLQEVSADAFNAAMDNIRKSVEESTELTEEAKTALLNLLDETQKKWDDLQAEKEVEKVKEKFSDLQSVMGDVSGLLNEMGVSDTFSQMFSGLQMIIDGYGQLQIAIEKAKAAETAINMATAFGAIATMITGLIRSVGTLVNRIFTITDIEGPLHGLVDTYDKLTRAIDRSVGAQKKARQEEASENLKNQKEELEREYAKEASKWGFSFTILGKKIQILGPDQGVLNELTSQINEVETAMQQLGDTMKSDFLQTDYESFSDALSEILTSPWDSFEDMMGAVDDLVDTTLDRITNKWLTTKFLQGKIDAALENLYAAGDPTEEAYDKFREAVKEASAYYLQEADKLGIGNYSSGSSNSDYDTIRRISAEDFSKWLGEWRAQRIALVDNGNMLKNIYAQLKSLAESPTADPELLDLTRRIEVNTAILPVLLPQILDTLKSNTNGLKPYGY